MNLKPNRRQAKTALATAGATLALLSPCTRSVAQNNEPIFFGDITLGQSNDLTWVGSLAANYSDGFYVSVSITGTDKNDFQVISDDTTGFHHNGDSTTETIRFTPSHPGMETAQITTFVTVRDVTGPILRETLVGNGAPRAFFYIAYLNDDKTNPGSYQSFPDAAATWEREIKAQYQFNPKQGDNFFEANVRSASDFVNAWNEIDQTLRKGHYAIIAGGLFTHSSEPGPSLSHGFILESGLEFAADPGVDPATAGSTVTKELIDTLPKLNWDQKGNLQLFGCNTGAMRGVTAYWSPASEFAQDQHVITLGEVGPADFSESNDHYVEISSKSKNVYLGAFNRLNTALGPLGNGVRIPPKSFQP